MPLKDPPLEANTGDVRPAKRGRGHGTSANFEDDGRVDVTINEEHMQLAALVNLAFRESEGYESRSSDWVSNSDWQSLLSLPLNIVIQVVGSRGDVQPFIALGKELKEKHRHRVRIATHSIFKGFVEENGLEFFNIGGDPSELMAFMVKNPHLLPNLRTLRSGDISKRRKCIYDILKGCWRSCIERGNGMGPSPTNRDYSSLATNNSHFEHSKFKPFIADAIIANPPSFAHMHCAERLGVPVHLMFTMPWSPTQTFPHPLADIRFSNANKGLTNFMTYALVDVLTWQGLGDVINQFRKRCLSLEPLSILWAPGIATRMRIPFTYCWSPSLIPKPADWESHISVSGYFNLPVQSSFQPDPSLVEFLTSGPPPIYIGFGSIVVDDSEALTDIIFNAIAEAGVRALVSKGWGGFGNSRIQIPANVKVIDNVPHDWLFKHVAAVVHHGGAGTTAAGITAGKPTVIVPFFGDQPFWGAMVARAGAGPAPIPFKRLNSHNLSAAIKVALSADTVKKAELMGISMATENGCTNGAESFHANLPLKRMQCSLIPSRTAVWRVKRSGVRLSALAAAVLEEQGLLTYADLKLYRAVEHDLEGGPWDPISGGAIAILGTLGSLLMGFAHIPTEIRQVSKDYRGVDVGKTTTQGHTPQDLISSGHVVSSEPTGIIELSEARSQDDRHVESTSPTQKPSKSIGWKPDEELCGSWGTNYFEHNHSFHRNQALPSPYDMRENSIGVALGFGKAFARIASVGLKSPMDFSISLARGFQHTQKMLGDKTVRRPERVTDLKSGFAAAGRTLGFGFLDALSGIIVQPVNGARDGGPVGLVKGIGRGLSGIVLKPGAAMTGFPAYALKGMYKELKNYISLDFSRYIVAARKAEGEEELRNSTEETRSSITQWWQ